MGTAIVGVVLVVAVAAIITSQIKNKKRGASSCGGGCAHCAMGATCHAHGGATDGDGKHTTVLSIDGMMCGMCESHINDAIRNNFAVTSVTSSHKKGRTEIISDSALDEAKLRAVIEQTGYKLTAIS